jgi:hypothetical protein
MKTNIKQLTVAAFICASALSSAPLITEAYARGQTPVKYVAPKKMTKCEVVNGKAVKTFITPTPVKGSENRIMVNGVYETDAEVCERLKNKETDNTTPPCKGTKIFPDGITDCPATTAPVSESLTPLGVESLTPLNLDN